jgi:hypothetical protein
MLPESWLVLKDNTLQDTRTAIASHHGTAADPSQPPATQRSAVHSINHIKSNESQSAHCMLSLTHNTLCE